MSQTFNVYCDESSHLENDGQSVMVLGAVWCPLEKVREISTRLREIKERNGLKPLAEIKWTKVSPAKQQCYLDILDYFFDDDDLHFRALVIPDKSKLRHSDFSQTHDDWYYKMYFSMLKVILEPNSVYRIYLDIKDTRSENKIRKLHEFLCNHVQDSERRIVEKLQSVRSHEVSILQLSDLLIGAVNYANRNLQTSEAKLKFVQRLRERSHCDLTRSTLPLESKVNISVWKAQEGED
jgi:Protein of unknown function (DUF3800)